MPVKKNPKVDAYIKKSAPFARPILEKIRSAFHKGCPQLEEEIKWGVPHFTHRGILGGMAAFKKHVAFGFWNSKQMKDPEGWFAGNARASMCNIKITDVRELPAQKKIAAYVKEATMLNEQGSSTPQKTKKKPVGPVPSDLAAALRKNKKATATFNNFPPSAKREYIEWITEAKRDETRTKRLKTTIEWLAEGKRRNWKYKRS